MAQDVWQGTLYGLSPDGDREAAVSGSQATVRRDGDAVEIELKTSELTAGNAYTVWVMAFNDPSACRSTTAPPGFRCGAEDMGNADVGFGLMFGGAGGFADGETMEFRGRRVAGDPSGVELGTAGLRDAGRAEIHLRVRDHGPAQPGLADAQVSTIMGGCTDDAPPGGSGTRGNYPCRDVQATGL
jgi:hypothetical protein